jgi:integrase
VRTRWIPAIGHLQMSELYARPEYILEAQTNWRTNGVEVRNRRRRPRRIIPSDVTLHHYRAKLNKAFAENRRLHNNQVPNPAEAAGDVPPLEPKEIITLTREEARSLQAVAESSDDIRTQLILFGLHMGMRPGELLGLRRRDIDWNNGFIQVRQTVAQLRKRGLVIQANRAKNRISKAPVELTAGATQALVRAAAIQSQQIQDAGSAWEDHNLVFTNPIGRPINPQWLRAYFRQLLEQAGITQVTMHGLRHTHATLLLEDGTHPKFVQERLRHSRISVTMDTYSQVIPTMRAGTAARVDRLLGTRSNPPGFDASEQ